jgi:hypothetical protein
MVWCDICPEMVDILRNFKNSYVNINEIVLILIYTNTNMMFTAISA